MGSSWLKVAAVFTAGLCGCFGSPPTKGLAGLVCTKNEDCGASAQCVSGRCSALDAPTITGVAGDGPSGRIFSGLVITGEHLAQATARLLSADAGAVLGELVIGSADASTLHTTIPTELANALAATSGNVTLEVASARGAARQQVQVLRGEQGAAGSAGPTGLQGPQGTVGSAGVPGPTGAFSVIVKAVVGAWAYCTNDGAISPASTPIEVPISGSCAGPAPSAPGTASTIGTFGQGLTDASGAFAAHNATPVLGGGYYCHWTSTGTTMVVCLVSY